MESEEARVIHVLQAAGTNGFGFQIGGVDPPGTLVVAFVQKHDRHSWRHIDLTALTTQLQTHFQTSHVSIENWIGHVYLKVHWKEYQRIPAILQYLLDHQYIVSLANVFKLCYQGGDKFDPAEMEKRFVSYFREQLVYFKDAARKNNENPYSFVLSNMSRRDVFLRPWNWTTAEGQSFCRELREQLHVTNEEPELDYTKWKGVSDLIYKYKLYFAKDDVRSPPIPLDDVRSPPIPLDDVRSPPIHLDDDEVKDSKNDPVPPQPEPTVCFLCEDKLINTRVLPCEHMVVCKSCSDRLKTTGDRQVCIQCRQPITMILCDGCVPEDVN